MNNSLSMECMNRLYFVAPPLPSIFTAEQPIAKVQQVALIGLCLNKIPEAGSLYYNSEQD